VDLHQLELRFEALRSKSASKERRLMASLLESGQQLPLIVVGSETAGRYVVIDGYKRVRALKKLHVDQALVTTWALEPSEALVLEQLMRSSDGAGCLEQGWLLAELQERFGLTQEELARRFDKSQSWVSRRLALVRELPEAIQRVVRDGELSSHIATKLLIPMARAKPGDACRLAKVMARLRLSTRDAQRLYAGYLDSGERGRELLLEKPELYLRAEQESTLPKSEAPSPIEQIVGELDALATMARRTFRRLGHSRLRLALAPDREQVERVAQFASLRTRELFDRIDSELAHAGSKHP
jgi:ParB/RepB/Spo0J family partition protein